MQLRFLPLFLLSLSIAVACGDDPPRDAGSTPTADGGAGADTGDHGHADATNADAEGRDADDRDADPGPDGGDAEPGPDGGDAAADGGDAAAADGGDAQIGVDFGPAPDTGVSDVGPGADSGIGIDRVPPGLCPFGQEGCECTSTATSTPIPFLQEDCDPGLLCVNWDLISGLSTALPNPELDGPVKTCVAPCLTDGDCGVGRLCRSFGFSAATGAERICVDRVAGYDEPCSGSRSNVERIADPAISDWLDTITACEDGLTCQLFTFGAAFNPDEGLCANLCSDNQDCAGYPQLPYCNPRAFVSTSTVTPNIGVCTDAPHPHGAICGSTDFAKPFRLSTGCDTSAVTCGADRAACPICVSINFDASQSLTPEGQGLCVSACNAATPCFDNRTCIPGVFSNGDGLCSDQCTAIPETCPGAGSQLHGQDCLDLQIFGSFCIDRYLPPLAPAEFDLTGNIVSPGGDCGGDLNNYSFFRCPERSTCVTTGASPAGVCVYGCDPADPALGDQLCRQVLSNANAACTTGAGIGICGE